MTNQAGPSMLSNEPRRWDFLSGICLQLGLKTFVEVGCKEGRTTGHILKSIPDIQVVAIDPWCVQESNGDPKRETYQEWDFAKIEKEFWENVGEHKDRVTFHRRPATEVADIYAKSRQFDLVFIDALHDYESVKRDIADWWPLVRKGGVLAGHDFNHKWPGVERAIADSFCLMDVGVGTDSVWFAVRMTDEAKA